MTPEGRVKALVKRALDRFKTRYEFWPVPGGYGPSSLDCLLCINGHFVAVETKAPGKKPTPRQRNCTRMIEQAGGRVFIIDSAAGVVELVAYIEKLQNVEHQFPDRDALPVSGAGIA